MTNLLCLLCQATEVQPARTALEGHLCTVHYATLPTIITDILRLYTHVSDAQFLSEQRDRDSERWVGSKAPTDSGVLAILDYRTKAGVKGDRISVSRVLKVWAYAILDTLEQETQEDGISFSHDSPMPHQTVQRYIQLHLDLLPWLCDHPDVVVRYARHMAALRRQLLRLIPQY